MRNAMDVTVRKEVSETTYTEVVEDKDRLLPQLHDYLDTEKQFRKALFFYEAGLQQIMAKLEILNREFQYGNDRNPIENVKGRVKSEQSIVEKMKKKGLPMTISAMMNNIYDIAGVRVICPFISDVYQVGRMVLSL